jgi:acyl-coenzyme A thioesterase PaaI-like protein
MTTLDPRSEQRCRDSFARQQAMITIGASVLSVAAGEVELAMPFSEKFTQQHASSMPASSPCWAIPPAASRRRR